MVPADWDYKLFINVPKGWTPKTATATAGAARIERSAGNVWTVILNTDGTRGVRWKVRFEGK